MRSAQDRIHDHPARTVKRRMTVCGRALHKKRSGRQARNPTTPPVTRQDWQGRIAHAPAVDAFVASG
ncbi:hypothetical protein [Streptomyces sp. NPDC055107]